MIKKEKKDKMCELIKACIYYGGDSKDKKITKTKLAKLVYLADFVFYYYNFKSITGETYKKLNHGPVANSFFDCLKELERNDEIDIANKGRAKIISLLENNDFDLKKEELKIIKKICDKWRDRKTGEIEKFTHNQIPWKISFDKDEVPYSLIIQQNERKLY